MRVTARLAALFLLTGACAAAAAPPPAPPPGRPGLSGPAMAGPGKLAAHRAFYQLTLDSARGERQIASATGTMGYEVADVCDGWATRQRLRINIAAAEGQDTEMDSDYATWESKDGLNFRFHMVQKTDSAITSQTDGGAKLSRTGGPGEARFRVPAVEKNIPVLILNSRNPESEGTRIVAESVACGNAVTASITARRCAVLTM